MTQHRKKITEQNKSDVPTTTEYRHHLIVFSVVLGQKHVAVYRGVILPSYRVLEHSFSVMGWEDIEAWAQELVDNIWEWYLTHKDEEDYDLQD